MPSHQPHPLCWGRAVRRLGQGVRIVDVKWCSFSVKVRYGTFMLTVKKVEAMWLIASQCGVGAGLAPYFVLISIILGKDQIKFALMLLCVTQCTMWRILHLCSL